MTLTEEQLQILQEIDTISRTKTVETWEKYWLEYMRENLKAPSRRSLSDFSIPDKRNKETLAIVGPGPSITQYQDRLDELREVATICVLPTALEWSHAHGLDPDFVVIQDSGHDEPKFFCEGDYPTIGPTTLNPKVVAQQNAFLFTLMLGDYGRKDPLFGEWNRFSLWLDYDLDGGVTSLGCVSNLAIELIEMFRASGQLRAKRIVLFGQDFGGWKNLARVPRTGETECPLIDTHMNGKYSDQWVEWNGFYTDTRMILYKLKLLRLWAKTEAPLYSCSNGMLHELPYVFFDMLLRGKFPKRYPKKKEIEERYTAYAALMADTFPREEGD